MRVTHVDSSLCPFHLSHGRVELTPPDASSEASYMNRVQVCKQHCMRQARTEWQACHSRTSSSWSASSMHSTMGTKTGPGFRSSSGCTAAAAAPRLLKFVPGRTALLPCCMPSPVLPSGVCCVAAGSVAPVGPPAAPCAPLPCHSFLEGAAWLCLSALSLPASFMVEALTLLDLTSLDVVPMTA